MATYAGQTLRFLAVTIQELQHHACCSFKPSVRTMVEAPVVAMDITPLVFPVAHCIWHKFVMVAFKDQCTHSLLQWRDPQQHRNRPVLNQQACTKQWNIIIQNVQNIPVPGLGLFTWSSAFPSSSTSTSTTTTTTKTTTAKQQGQPQPPAKGQPKNNNHHLCTLPIWNQRYGPVGLLSTCHEALREVKARHLTQSWKNMGTGWRNIRTCHGLGGLHSLLNILKTMCHM